MPNNWQSLNFREDKGSLESQMRALRGNRSFFGTENLDNYQDPNKFVASSESNGGDDGGYRTVYRARSDAGLSGNNETGVYIKGDDGQEYMRVPLTRTDDSENGFSAAELGIGNDPALINRYLGISAQEWNGYTDAERQHILENTYFHPDNSHGWGEVQYSDKYGFIMPTSSLRDPDARRDNWITGGMFAAVAAPAIAGIAGAEGAGAATAETGMDTGGLEGGLETASDPTPYEPFESNYPGNQQWTPPSEGTTPTTSVPTQSPAPVSNASPGVPGTNNGIIDTLRNGYNSVSSWYNGLSPASRFILNTAVSQGASAAIGANAQRNAQQYAEQQEQRQRDDRARRTSVQAFRPGATGTTGTSSSPFTRKAGIIDPRRA